MTSTTLSVIGAGFGRTGTESLKTALEYLGFGPCYHMFELDQRIEHIEQWRQARTNADFDFSTILRDYRSAVDWPTCAYYRRLIAAYPESKVVLTTRDPHAWFNSANQTIFRALRERHLAPQEQTRRLRAMSAELIEIDTFGGNLHDEAHCVRIFNEHIAEVKRTVPPHRLLVFDVAEGWVPLCQFLGCDVPSIAFPTSNAGDRFQTRVFGKIHPQP